MIFQTEFPDNVIALYNAFLSWFLALSFPAQVLTAAFIILGFIAAGYIIYGVFWLAFQIVKASIVTSIILIYLTIAGIILAIELIGDRNRIEDDWAEVCYNIKYFIAKAYPRPKEPLPQKPVRKNGLNSKNDNAQGHNTPLTRSQQPPVIIIKQAEPKAVSANIEAHEEPAIPKAKLDYESQADFQPAQQTVKEYFCPSCGNKFSTRMTVVLKEQPFTFCEHCGEKFYRRDNGSDVQA